MEPPSSDSLNPVETPQTNDTALAELASIQQQQNAASMHQDRPTHPQTRRRQKCRYFGTKKGCRSGDACPYLHVAPNAAGGSKPESTPSEDAESGSTQLENRPATLNVQRETVAKPVSKTEQEAPRNFQLGQLRRRFHPKEEQDDAGNTTFTISMAPTDPDFPFDMPKLHCSLLVPRDWPAETARPRLRVTNPDMPRGFQINVERGFDGLIDAAFKEGRNITLLGLMNNLDRNLERFLTAEKAPTIKLVVNTISPKRPLARGSGKEQQQTKGPIADEKASKEEKQATPATDQIVYSANQRAEAEKTRNAETRQLEARLNRVSLFKKLSDGNSYIIPITPTKPERLPVQLRVVKSVKLNVPPLYPLEKSSIELQAVDAAEARAVELGFEHWVRQGPHSTLMAQVNYLAHNMHLLVNVSTRKETLQSSISASVPADIVENPPSFDDADETQDSGSVDSDRPHLKFVPRPPEWSMPVTLDGNDSDDSSFEDSSDSHDLDSTEESQDGGAPIAEAAESSTLSSSPARGTAVNLPGLELYGIELLEPKMLSITVKCDRCKEHTDIKNIKATDDPSQPSPVKVESCRKCANSFNIAFRRQLMHPNSHRAGYLDLEGCTAFDLLPSHFQPTCSECSTPFPAPGLVAVRGDAAMASCRECHRKMNFKISEVKFMIVGVSALSHQRVLLPRKKVRENLGIVAGQELPRRGRCKHYSKSYRWFRFSCCAKVFPCDKCHDAEMDHPNEHGNRMICGFCSREQVYRPETCGICRNVLVGKAGSGFWEGGKGTRDKVKMSKKDPRKYKRISG